MLHGHRTKDFFYYWVSLLGDKTEAEKFLYEIKLSPDPEVEPKNKKLSIAMKLPVVAYHQFPEFKKLAPNVAAIPFCSLMGFGKSADEENKFTIVNFSLDIVSRS